MPMSQNIVVFILVPPNLQEVTFARSKFKS